MAPARREVARGTLLGLAVADALGAPLEFCSPASAERAARAGLAMEGGGPWRAGEWTDDTAMALCLAESIAVGGLLDLGDVARRYIAWVAGGPKDVGITIRTVLTGARDVEEALARAAALQEATGKTAGNGTVMRAAPIALTSHGLDVVVRAARADAGLTHGDPAAGHASAALCAALRAVIDGHDPLAAARVEVEGHPQLVGAVRAAADGDAAVLADLAGGTAAGVCWTALGVALYALERIDDYRAGVTWAISLGGDTDTNAAVAGALLGCRHGVGAIPLEWIGALRDRDRVERAAEGLAGV